MFEERQSGFSLLEVIIALGMLAGVLIAIGSMLILGGRQIRAGRNLTAATTLARDLMETYGKRAYVTLAADLGAAPNENAKSVSSTTRGSPIQSWQARINRQLHDGSATVSILPLGGGAASFASAAGIRVSVTVTWRERGWPRSVVLSTVRF